MIPAARNEWLPIAVAVPAAAARRRTIWTRWPGAGGHAQLPGAVRWRGTAARAPQTAAVDIDVEIVVARHFVALAALFLKPHP